MIDHSPFIQFKVKCHALTAIIFQAIMVTTAWNLTVLLSLNSMLTEQAPTEAFEFIKDFLEKESIKIYTQGGVIEGYGSHILSSYAAVITIVWLALKSDDRDFVVEIVRDNAYTFDYFSHLLPLAFYLAHQKNRSLLEEVKGMLQQEWLP